MTEIPRQLSGGLANEGQVVRIGDTVRRPAGPHSEAIAALLDHLRVGGFDGAPVALGKDPEGRDVFGWIEGEAPIPPLPAWALADEALIDTARLIRRLHDALASFDPPPGASWSEERADPRGGPLICHTDICPENVVFREGRAIAILDFDFASPGRPVWDLAMAEDAFAHRHVEAGEAGFVAMWKERGGAEWFDGVVAWMEGRRGLWLEALRG